MNPLETANYAPKLHDRNIGRYCGEIKKYPRIAYAEERELLAGIKNGDQEALNKLVCSYLGFVIWIALRYQNFRVPLPDLISEGNIGLISGVKKYEIRDDSNVSLTTYVAYTVRQEIIRAIMYQRRTVWLPDNHQKIKQKIKKALPRLEQTLGREPSNLEIARDIGVTEAEVAKANEFGKRETSFDRPLTVDGYSLYSLVSDKGVPPPDERVMRESLPTEIGRVLKRLSKREAGILTMYFGLNGTPAYFLHDIAAKYGISERKIKEAKCRALRKLKRILKESYVLNN